MSGESDNPARRWPGFGAQVLVGMVLGLTLGVAAHGLGPDSRLAKMLQLVGQIFAQLLKVLVPPLVFTAIVASVAALKSLANATRLVAATLSWFAATALIAVLIGIALGLLVQPGLHAGVDASAAARPGSTGGWLDSLKGLVPANIFGLSASTSLAYGHATTSLSFNVLQIMVIAVAVGAAAVRVGEAGAPFTTLIEKMRKYGVEVAA